MRTLLAIVFVAVALAAAAVPSGCSTRGDRYRPPPPPPPPPPGPVGNVPPAPFPGADAPLPPPVYIDPPAPDPVFVPQPPPPPPPPPPQPVLVQDPEIPLHEAIVGPAVCPHDRLVVRQTPPLPVQEMQPPPPGRGMTWIPGYWHYSARLRQWVWVTGCWRRVPPSMTWIPGRWAPAGRDGFAWVPGYWSSAPEAAPVVVNLPPPPPPVETPPARRPFPDAVWVPGRYDLQGNRYVYVPGQWQRPPERDSVWIEPAYVRGPNGYYAQPGHWDYAPERRGTAYQPEIVTLPQSWPGYNNFAGGGRPPGAPTVRPSRAVDPATLRAHSTYVYDAHRASARSAAATPGNPSRPRPSDPPPTPDQLLEPQAASATVGVVDEVSVPTGEPVGSAKRLGRVRMTETLRGGGVPARVDFAFNAGRAGELVGGSRYLFLWDASGRCIGYYPVDGKFYIKAGRREPLGGLRK